MREIKFTADYTAGTPSALSKLIVTSAAGEKLLYLMMCKKSSADTGAVAFSSAYSSVFINLSKMPILNQLLQFFFTWEANDESGAHFNRRV